MPTYHQCSSSKRSTVQEVVHVDDGCGSSANEHDLFVPGSWVGSWFLSNRKFLERHDIRRLACYSEGYIDNQSDRFHV
jgi:hypothetical protein